MKARLAAATLAAMVLVLVPLSQAAKASTLYGVELATGTGLFVLNQSTGAATLVGNTGDTNLGDMTSNETSTLWSVDLATDSLLTINPSTGAITGTTPVMGASGAPVQIVSLAWDPVTGVLYGTTALAYNGLVDQLFAINPTTGVATAIGSSVGFDNIYALGFSQNGTLYGISDNTNQLITISLTSGSGTLVSSESLAYAYDLAFNPTTDTMFVISSETDSLYTMNPSNGNAALVGPYGGQNMVGLAFLGTAGAATPESGTFTLLGLGFAGLGFAALRKAS